MGSLKELRADSRYLSVNIDGNKKLKNSDKVRFIIWNLPAVKTCPYATGNCKKSCYALKAERVYPNVKICREHNFKSSLQPDFIDNMIYTLDVEISRNEAKNIKTIVRIHESGDFYNQLYFDKWLQIASAFAGRNAVFMAYTKSVTYVKNSARAIPDNLFIRFSIWDDTSADQIRIAEALQLPIYTAFNREIADKLINQGIFSLCRCDDCGACGQCWDHKYKNLVCYIH